MQLTSQINGLESRLKFSRRDKEVTVSNCLCTLLLCSINFILVSYCLYVRNYYDH